MISALRWCLIQLVHLIDKIGKRLRLIVDLVVLIVIVALIVWVVL